MFLLLIWLWFLDHIWSERDLGLLTFWPHFVQICRTTHNTCNGNYNHLTFCDTIPQRYRFLIVFGLIVILTFALLISKSSRFIFYHNCTKIVNLVKFPQVAYKISCSQLSGRNRESMHGFKTRKHNASRIVQSEAVWRSHKNNSGGNHDNRRDPSSRGQPNQAYSKLTGPYA